MTETMTKKWSRAPFGPERVEEMERYLNEMSHEGWQCCEIVRDELRFVRGEQDEYTYRVQYFYESRDGEKDDYLRTLGETGAALVGEYGVQAGHNPVLVALHMGLMHFTVNGEEHEVLVGDGIAEVTPTFVLLLVDSAERPEDIDRNRAEAARIRAAERLQHKQSMHEYYQTKIALDRAMQRLQTAAKYKR